MLDESNKFMQEVQEELEKKNWREVVAEVMSRRDPLEGLNINENDAELDAFYA